MPINLGTSTITCDCCGFALPHVGVGYMEVRLGQNTLVFCNAHGCDAGVLATLLSTMTAAATAHQATTVAGVILAH